jgi:flavin-dependent dehydrogenase
MADERWVVEEEGIGVVVRRIEFDHALARQVADRGVEVRDGTALHEIEPTSRGMRLITSDGEIHARAVVGADGVAGIVRRAAAFPRAHRRAQAIEVETEMLCDARTLRACGHIARKSKGAGDSRHLLHFDFGFPDLNGYAWDFPTPGGETRPSLQVCRGIYRIVREPDNVRERLRAHLEEKGLSLNDYPVKPFAEQGFDPHASLSQPRVLLVGEAAGIDILSGEGIAQALQYGALAGPFLAEALRSGDLSFAGWTERVRSSQLGRQLLRRLVYFRLFFNRTRPAMEHLVRAIPSAIRMGLQDFAGKPIRGWSSFAWEVAPALARYGPDVAVRALTARSRSLARPLPRRLV